jgi:hypothetical protein
LCKYEIKASDVERARQESVNDLGNQCELNSDD